MMTMVTTPPNPPSPHQKQNSKKSNPQLINKLTANALKTHRQTFTRITTTLRYLGTNGLRLLLQFYFAKTPLFWIPTGWVPNYAAFLLAFPRAPRGSVSVQVWGIACATVVQMVFAAGAAGWVLLMRGREEGVGKQGRRREEEGVAMGGGGGGEGKKEI